MLKKGSIYLTELLFTDQKKSKIRPVVVLHHDVVYDDVIVMAISSVISRRPCRSRNSILISASDNTFKETGLKKESVILTNRIVTLNRKRLFHWLGRFSNQYLEEIDRNIVNIFQIGITNPTNQTPFIPYGKQTIDDDDVYSVIKTLRSDWLTTGPKVAEFEQAIADYVGAKYAMAVSSGTAALHIAVKALGIEKGMEGITSPITFVASSNCMLYNNLKPLFADIDSKTYCINPSKIEEKITSNTKLIIPVHFAGHPCDMNKIQDIARKYNLYVIEDAAHAIGSKYSDGSKVGNCNYSDMTIFSFHPVKTMTTGEGGAITTNNPKLYKKLKLLVTHGITKEKSEFKNYSSEPIGPWYYEMQTIGFNYRITDLQCALGISQLRKIDKFITKRREIVKRYNDAFNDIDEIIVPCEKKGFFSAYHLYVIQFKNSDRLRVFNELKKNNIGVNVHYIPVHFQPFYKENFDFKKGDYPIAENYYKRAVTLPLFPGMKDRDVEYVIQTVVKTLNRKTQTK